MQGAFERRIATPLIGNYPAAHHAAHDLQNPGIEEELRREARGIERHRQKVTMLTAIGIVPILVQVFQENGPKCFPATVN